MKEYNVIIVYNKDHNKILMCERAKEPYKGLFNLPGGKIEYNEDGFDAAYRELEEETGINMDQIKLTHFMDFNYFISNIKLEVYVGKLSEDVRLIEEVNKLYWIDLNNDFYNCEVFAGEGNIGHMIKQIDKVRELVFLEEINC